MNNLIDKYRPHYIFIEEQLIINFSFSEFYLPKVSRKKFLRKIKNRDLSEEEIKSFLYNMNVLVEEISEDDFIEIIASIKPKGNEVFKNIEYLIYKQLIYFFDDEVLSMRVKQLGRSLLHLIEIPKDNFRMSFYDFLKNNKNFINYLSNRLEIYLDGKKLNNFLIDHMIKEKSDLLDRIILNIIENNSKSKLSTWEINNKINHYIVNEKVLNKYIEKLST